MTWVQKQSTSFYHFCVFLSDLEQNDDLQFPWFIIHTLQLNFLFSDLLFSKYVDCIKNVHCTPRTTSSLREVLLVRDRMCERHIDWSIFFHWVKLLIFFMFSSILNHIISYIISIFISIPKQTSKSESHFIYIFSRTWPNDFCFSVVYELG